MKRKRFFKGNQIYIVFNEKKKRKIEIEFESVSLTFIQTFMYKDFRNHIASLKKMECLVVYFFFLSLKYVFA